MIDGGMLEQQWAIAHVKDDEIRAGYLCLPYEKFVFRDNGKRIGVDASGPGGIYTVPWKTAGLKKGVHHLTATLRDSAGQAVAAGRQLKICA